MLIRGTRVAKKDMSKSEIRLAIPTGMKGTVLNEVTRWAPHEARIVKGFQVLWDSDIVGRSRTSRVWSTMGEWLIPLDEPTVSEEELKIEEALVEIFQD